MLLRGQDGKVQWAASNSPPLTAGNPTTTGAELYQQLMILEEDPKP